MPKRQVSSKKAGSARSKAPADWRKRLYQKRFEIEAWDWKEDPRPYIRALCRAFKVKPALSQLVREFPERLLEAIARKHGLHVYDVPSLEGSDVYGFILSRETRTRREIQQIEADYWGEDFDEVYR